LIVEWLFRHEQWLVLATLTLIIEEDFTNLIFSWGLLFSGKFSLIIEFLFQLFFILFSWLRWHEKSLSFWWSYSLPLLWFHTLMFTHILYFFRRSWVFRICLMHVSLVVILSIRVLLSWISKVLFRSFLSNRVLPKRILFWRTKRILFFGWIDRIFFNFGGSILSNGVLLWCIWYKLFYSNNILAYTFVGHASQSFIVRHLFLCI